MPSRRRFAVLDIGSNSVRMIVYEQGRSALPLYNEKASCSLGKNIGKTGDLYQKGMQEAVLLLQRFAALAKQMKVSKTTAVATAAVRYAKNGKDFVALVKKKTGIKIRVISGKEEAQLSAEGMISAFPSADGIMGDMGGGSMELVGLHRGKIKKRISLPFGPLSLIDLGLPLRTLKIRIGLDLREQGWLRAAGRGKTFYAVGGVFRAMARLHMELSGYPLHVVHHYKIDRAPLLKFLRQCAAKKLQKRAQKIGIAKNRIAALPYAATVLLALFELVPFKTICFSTYGLREGVAKWQEKSKARDLNNDLLLETCRALALRSARFGLIGGEVYEFLAPLWKDLPKDTQRLFEAACWISDIGWADHPEERAKQIFHRILHAPLLAVDHEGRCFIALCCYSRYAGNAQQLGGILNILNKPAQQLAIRLGAGLRFADTLCGGAPGVLPKTKLSISPRSLTLHVAKSMPVGGGEELPKRFETLADICHKAPIIIQSDAK